MLKSPSGCTMPRRHSSSSRSCSSPPTSTGTGWSSIRVFFPLMASEGVLQCRWVSSRDYGAGIRQLACTGAAACVSDASQCQPGPGGAGGLLDFASDQVSCYAAVY
uniref:Uncharacterized protein n=1 Tax=Oryza brachyantha TaxID=4533 RepID=J3M854_ORYBR